MQSKTFILLSRLTLIFTIIVTSAGSIVRMSGSGMGCPDWPKCFGYYIPPSEESQVIWQENHAYLEGQMIVKDEALWSAKSDFTTTNTYQPNNWEKYTKHDYAIFNPLHTYTEYINRLCGALLGVIAFGMLVLSFFQKKKKLIFWSFITVVLIAFEAWLGKTVVESDLNPVKITIHMLGALVIVVTTLMILVDKHVSFKLTYKPSLKIALALGLVFTAIQILLGTQIREEIDSVSDIYARNEWIDHMGVWFWAHTVNTVLFTTAMFWLIYQLFTYRKVQDNLSKAFGWLIFTIIFSIFTGVVLGFGSMPPAFQPMHLVIGTILFSIQGYIFLRVVKK